jgi:hypothetical protein
MLSIDFVKTRAQATRDAQANIAATWTWSQKTVAQWDADTTALNQLIADESDKRIQWRNAAELWQSDIDKIQEITRKVKSLGSVQFRNNAVIMTLLDSLRTDATSRADIYDQGLAARDVWDEADDAWQITPTETLAAFSAVLESNLARQKAHSPAYAAWRRAAAALNNKAEAVDRDNVAWFTEATRRFPFGTTDGDLIRSTVPTTSRAEQPVGQAVISNLLVSGGAIHFDCSAPQATRYTYLHQQPASPAFVVALADSPETSFNLQGQPAGVHRFKVFGSNSRGQGAESDVVQVTVAASAAA